MINWWKAACCKYWHFPNLPGFWLAPEVALTFLFIRLSAFPKAYKTSGLFSCQLMFQALKAVQNNKWWGHSSPLSGSVCVILSLTVNICTNGTNCAKIILSGAVFPFHSFLTMLFVNHFGFWKEYSLEQAELLFTAANGLFAGFCRAQKQLVFDSKCWWTL